MPFELTERDLAILEKVYQFRFLTVDQLTVLCGIPYKTLTRRLQKLFHHGLLDRPLGQVQRWIPGTGSQKFVYALADKGAELLTRQPPLGIAGLDWKEKNRRVGPQHITHTLGVNTLYVSLIRALGSRSDLTLEEWRQWDHLKVKVEIPTRDGQLKPVGLIPDAFFTLDTGGDDLFPFMLEHDESTQPIQRSSAAASSIRQKLLSYAALWQQGKDDPRSPLQSTFGVDSFRTLFVTSSPQRVASMVALCQKLFMHGRRLFWFCTHDRVTLEDPAWLEQPVWYNGQTELDGSGRLIGPPLALLD